MLSKKHLSLLLAVANKNKNFNSKSIYKCSFKINLQIVQITRTLLVLNKTISIREIARHNNKSQALKYNI